VNSMNTTSILVILTGLFLRIVLPLAVTALIAYALHQLDARWQRQAKLENEQLLKHEIPCWKEQGISAEQMKMRAAMGEIPCWQTHRAHNGYLRDDCLDCEVFHSAPMQPLHSHVHTFKM